MKQKTISLPITDDINALLSHPHPVVALNLMGLYLFMTGKMGTDKVIFWVDGIFGRLACRLNNIHVDRIPGRDIVKRLIVFLSKHNKSRRLKILGGPPVIENLSAMVGHSIHQIEFPLLSETELMSFDYSQFSAKDIIIIAVASPKQELIAEAIFSATKAKCICAGGAINMLAGNETPAPRLVVSLGIESLFRLQHEPVRRIKRIVRTLPKGCIGAFRIKLHRGV